MPLAQAPDMPPGIYLRMALIRIVLTNEYQATRVNANLADTDAEWKNFKLG